MFFQSSIWRLFLKGISSLRKAVKTSFLLGASASFFDWISHRVKTSLAYSWLDSNVLTDEAYETSWFYKKLYSLKRPLWPLSKWTHASLCFRLCRSIVSRLPMDVILAFFAGIMLIVPHERWHNIYFVIVAYLFVLLLLINGSFKGLFGKKQIFLLLGLLLALSLSVVLAIEKRDALRFFLFFSASLGFQLCVTAVLDSEEKFMQAMNIILLFVGLAGALGVAQRLAGLAVDPEFVDVQTNQMLPGRVFSTFSNPNNFAQVLVLFMPFFIPAILYSKYIRVKIVLSASLILSVVSLVMTYSRSAWLGLVSSIIVFVCIFDKRKLLWLIVVSLAVIPFLPQSVLGRILTIGSLEDSSNAYRLHIWRGCLAMLRDVWFAGVGLGPQSFQSVYPVYASRAAAVVPHSHMLVFQIILETGVPGLWAFLAYMIDALKQTLRHMPGMSKRQKGYGAAGVGALCGMFIIGLFEYIWFYPRVMFVFWMVPGFLTALIRITKRD